MYLYDNELVTGLPKIGGMSSVCEPCVCGKHAKMPLVKESLWRARRVHEMVHCHVWEQAQRKSMGGSRYFLTLVVMISQESVGCVF